MMRLRSRLIRSAATITSLLFLFLSASLPAKAVTEKEMEEARTAAAILYLRWADNGSGYLDELKPAPKSIAELEKKLKKKELENLAPFKAIPLPADYSGWTKEKFVEYWSSTVFNSPKLSADGKRAKDRVRKKVSAMTVSAPTGTDTPSQPEKEAPSAEKVTEADNANPPMPDFNDVPEVAAAADSIMEAQEQLAEAQEELTKKKETSYTWVYIVVLCVLVAIVIWLVIFASKVMKNEPASKRRASDEESLENNARALEAANAEQTEVNTRMTALLEKKNEEIASLRRHNESLTSEAASLRTKLMDTQAQLEATRRNLEETRAEARAAAAAAKPVERLAEPQAVQTPRSAATPAYAEPAHAMGANNAGEKTATTIYLGRANHKGIFVRADRHLTPGKTFFRLDTSDGYAGTFRVANNPMIWELALLTPHESLEGACTAKNFDDTEGKTTVVNEAAGTAIFENGCWKVIRKAKIRFE